MREVLREERRMHSAVFTGECVRETVAVNACADNGLLGFQHAIYCANGIFSVPPYHPIE
jgi:hypothetical protein